MLPKHTANTFKAFTFVQQKHVDTLKLNHKNMFIMVIKLYEYQNTVISAKELINEHKDVSIMDIAFDSEPLL